MKLDNSEKNMYFSKVINILTNPDKGRCSYQPPLKPAGGEVYLLSWEGNDKNVNDYVADGYMWVFNTTKTITIKYCKTQYSLKNYSIFVMLMVLVEEIKAPVP